MLVEASRADGVPVEYRNEEGETRGGRAKLFDPQTLSANEFLVVRQLIVRNGEHTRRPDLTVFLNGLPIAVIELKDPTSVIPSIMESGALRPIQAMSRRPE
jgi:type I restriction enzyme R subunit